MDTFPSLLAERLPQFQQFRLPLNRLLRLQFPRQQLRSQSHRSLLPSLLSRLPSQRLQPHSHGKRT
jgi:hypothetical protein